MMKLIDLKNMLRIPEEVTEDDVFLQLLLDSGTAYILNALGQGLTTDSKVTEDPRFQVAVLSFAVILYQNNGEYTSLNGLPYTLQTLITQLQYTYNL